MISPCVGAHCLFRYCGMTYCGQVVCVPTNGPVLVWAPGMPFVVVPDEVEFPVKDGAAESEGVN